MKYVGLDLGSVTCGISNSDSGHFAQAVKTIRFKADDYDEALVLIEEYLNSYKPNIVVLGYPLLENGDVGPRAQLSIEFSKALIEDGFNVKLQDERCTTKDSEEFLISAGVSRSKRKKIIDQQAAVRILQYYLDSIKP